MQIAFILMVAGMVLYVAMVAVAIRELHKWGRNMDKWAARREREHQEYMISFELDARRRQAEHEEFMKRLNSRRRW